MNFPVIPLVWPLVCLLVALFIVRKVGDDMRPIVRNVVGGIAVNAQQHALAYGMATLLALLGSLQALAEVATAFQWVYVAAAAKVIQPGLAAIVAYVTKPPAFTQAAPDLPPVKTPAPPNQPPNQ